MKKTLFIFALSVSVFILLLASCKNNPFAVARVKYLGSTDSGGCGFVLEIAGEDFHATNLDTSIVPDDSLIDITFTYGHTDFICSDTLREVEILSVEPHD